MIAIQTGIEKAEETPEASAARRGRLHDLKIFDAFDNSKTYPQLDADCVNFRLSFLMMLVVSEHAFAQLKISPSALKLQPRHS